MNRIEDLLDCLADGPDSYEAEASASEMSDLFTAPMTLEVITVWFTGRQYADAWHTCAGLTTGPRAGLCRAFAQMAQCKAELHA